MEAPNSAFPITEDSQLYAVVFNELLAKTKPSFS
jgi:hypothetical protein